MSVGTQPWGIVNVDKTEVVSIILPIKCEDNEDWLLDYKENLYNSCGKVIKQQHVQETYRAILGM